MEKTTASDLSLKAYRSGFVFSFFNSTSWMVVLGTPAVLLAEALGANTFQVGLLYSFIFLLLPFQVLATATLPRFGYKKQVIFAWATRAVFLLVPAGIAISGPPQENPTQVFWLLLAMFLFCVFRSIGTCGVQPWLFDLLPEKLQARYFSTDMAVINVGGVITLAYCSLTFKYLDTQAAFSAQYGFAILGSILCIVGLAKLPSVPNPQGFGSMRIFTEGPRLLVRPGNFRRYLFLSLFWVVSGSAVVPFSIFYLKTEAGFSQSTIVLFTALQSLGGIVGALLIKNHIDRIGIRRSFLIVNILNILIYLGWVVILVDKLTYGTSSLYINFLLPATYVLLGAAGATYFSTHLKYLAFVTEKRERALKVSLQTAVVGLTTGLASIAWGLLFKESGNVPGMNLYAFLGYFVFVIGIQLVLVPFIRSLQEADESVKPLTNRYSILRLRLLTTIPVLRRRKQTKP